MYRSNSRNDIHDQPMLATQVKFTVHTRSTLEDMNPGEHSVVREHEEFIWLHTVIEEHPSYAGYIVSLE